jgi:hypothetical protein
MGSEGKGLRKQWLQLEKKYTYVKAYAYNTNKAQNSVQWFVKGM